MSAAESETQFLMGNLLSAKGNLTGALYHYEKVLSLAPDHPHARDYLTALACHAHQTSLLQQPSSSSPAAPPPPEESSKLWAADEDNELSSPSSGADSEDAYQPEDVELLSVKAFCEKGVDCFTDSDIDGGGYLLEEDDDDDVAPEQDEEFQEKARSQSFLSSALLPSLPPDSSASMPHHSLPADTEPSFDTHVEIEDLPTADWLLRNKEASDWLLRNAEAPLGGGVAKDGDFCEGYKKTVALRHFTSTWLSVSAKYIDISTYLPEAPVPLPPQSPSPVCPSVPASLPSLDHLSGVRHRHKLPHLPEAGLLEALHTLVDPPQSMEQLGHRLHSALQQHALSSPGGWVVCTGAALYWRVEGNAENAIDCLRAALLHAPHDMRDVPLTSLANVLHRSGLYNNALIAANAALEISPKFVVIHFTLANILGAMGEYQKAATFYESTLALQSTFEPAKERLLAIYCEEHFED
ncbi:Tetratricopeptide repeat [Trinorchestia longiramus]|nr:Tetratricopeptide repeat [Trinorchestia longiramus]